MGAAHSSAYVVCLTAFTRHLRSWPSPLRMASSDTVSFVTAIRQLRWCNIQFRSLRDTQHLRAAMLNPVRLPQFQSLPLSRARAPFSQRVWIFEVKWDGFRSRLYSDSDGVRLVSRNGNLSVTLNTIADLAVVCPALL